MVAVGVLLICRLLGLGGESIEEDVNKATPALFDLGGDDAMTTKASPTSLGKQQGANIATKKAAPHEATASCPMQADEAMTTKAAPHKAATSGPTQADKAMTMKAAPHEAAASGPMQANEAMTTQATFHEATARGRIMAIGMTTDMAPAAVLAAVAGETETTGIAKFAINSTKPKFLALPCTDPECDSVDSE